MPSRVHVVLVVLVILCGAGLRARGFTRPWSGVHEAWGGATYGNVARNYVRYGYIATRLAPVASTGRVEPSRFEHHYHYGPLFVWLVSLSFHAFGVHEWSARLVSLVFAILQMPLLYWLGRRLLGATAALVALAVFALSPVAFLYGSHVDAYGPQCMFFSVLAVAGYTAWAQDGSRAGRWTCILSLAAGAATAWHAYFVAALLAAHALLLGPRGRRERLAVATSLAGCVVVVFALFLLHRHFTVPGAGGEVHGTLMEKLHLRTSYSGLARAMLSGPVPVGFGGFVFWHARDAARMLSPLPLLLAVAWVATFLADLARRSVGLGDWMLAVLLGAGVLHDLVFPGVVLGHDFLVSFYAPGVALACGALIVRAQAALAKRTSPRRASVAAFAATVLVLASCVALVVRLRPGGEKRAGQVVRWGELVRTRTGESELVLSAGGPDRVLQYYLDRPTQFDVDTPQEVESRPDAALLIFEASDVARHGELVTWLDGVARREEVDGLVIYTLSQRFARPTSHP